MVIWLTNKNETAKITCKVQNSTLSTVAAPLILLGILFTSNCPAYLGHIFQVFLGLDSFLCGDIANSYWP